MIRSMILTAALSAAALGGLAMTPATADARPPLGQFHRARFVVMVRHHNHWDRHGTYHDRDDARRAARYLRHQGYQVRVERI